MFFVTGSGTASGTGPQAAGQTMTAPPGFEGVVDGVFLKPINNMTQMAGFLDSLAAARRR